MRNLPLGRLFMLPAAFAALLLPVLGAPADAAGWLLFYFIILLTFTSRELGTSWRLRAAAGAVVLVHQAIAVFNAYGGTVIGANADAKRFHREAELLAGTAVSEWTIGVGTRLYKPLLAAFYKVFGSSIFLGEELSVLAFTISCITLMKIFRLLEIPRFRAGTLLLYGLLPSCIIFTSVTLREAWQVLFFLVCVLTLLRLRERSSPGRLLAVIAAAGTLALWHNGFVIYAVFYLVAGLHWAYGSRARRGLQWKRWAALLLAAGLVTAALANAERFGGAALQALASGDALEYADGYQDSLTIDARANYGVTIDTSSLPAMVRTLALVVFYYFFAPLPWQVGNALDVAAFIEGALRTSLLLFAVITWRRSRGERRSHYGMLLLLFLAMEGLWSLGTINWGTAIRHHLIAYPVLVLLGGPPLLAFLRNMLLMLFVPPPSVTTRSPALESAGR